MNDEPAPEIDSELAWLQNWYRAQCNGSWEQSFGVRIETVARGGWFVVVDLTGTALESRPCEPVRIDRDEHDWVDCKAAYAQFIGSGGPANFAEILRAFRVFAEG